MSSRDAYFASIPLWMRRFAYVHGQITSAPLDLPGRFEAVLHHLQAAGWRVVVKSIGTDFIGPLGLPVPRSQPVELLLHRDDRGYTAPEAQAALAAALRAVHLNYSPIAAWLHELGREVVAPTVRQARQGLELGLGALPWVVVGVLAWKFFRAPPR